MFVVVGIFSNKIFKLSFQAFTSKYSDRCIDGAVRERLLSLKGKKKPNVFSFFNYTF